MRRHFPVPNCIEKDSDGLSLHGWEVEETIEEAATDKPAEPNRKKVVREKRVSPITYYSIPEPPALLLISEEPSITSSGSWLWLSVAAVTIVASLSIGYYLYKKKEQ